MASRSEATLRDAIRQFLADNPNTPLAGELRKVDHSLGGGNPAGPLSPGQQAARQGQQGASADTSGAKPGTPGHDLNNPSTPGGSNVPFGGIKKHDTAKALARMRFKKAGAKS